MSKYMVFFTFMVIGTFVIAAISQRISSGRPGGLGHPKPNILGFLIPAAVFTFFSGVRSNLGDTEMYTYSFYLLDPDTMGEASLKLEGGMMYPLMQHYCRLRYDTPHTLLLITAAMAIVPVIYILYKYSFPYEMGIAFFILTGYYTFSMNGIRQYAAAGILLLGAKYLFSEKKTDFLKYLIFVIIAWLMHSSALIMIPIYFIVRRRSWTPFTMILLLGTVFVTMVFDSILPSFLGVIEDSAFGQYAENGWFTSGQEGGSDIIRVFVLLVPLVMAYLQKERMSFLHGRHWDILVNISIINLAFYILSLYNWIFARLAIYTSIYVIIMMTYVINEGFEEYGQAITGVSLAAYSYYFYNIRYSVIGYRSWYF